MPQQLLHSKENQLYYSFFQNKACSYLQVVICYVLCTFINWTLYRLYFYCRVIFVYKFITVISTGKLNKFNNFKSISRWSIPVVKIYIQFPYMYSQLWQSCIFCIINVNWLYLQIQGCGHVVWNNYMKKLWFTLTTISITCLKEVTKWTIGVK